MRTCHSKIKVWVLVWVLVSDLVLEAINRWINHSMTVSKERAPQSCNMAIRRKSSLPLRSNQLISNVKSWCRQPSRREAPSIPWRVLRKRMSSKSSGRTYRSMVLCINQVTRMNSSSSRHSKITSVWLQLHRNPKQGSYSNKMYWRTNNNYHKGRTRYWIQAYRIQVW